MCTLFDFLITNQSSLIYQNAAASFKHERIPSTLGRATRSSIQHSSTILHSSSLNPRCFARSGFSGRTPSVIALIARISDGISRYGWCPHKT